MQTHARRGAPWNCASDFHATQRCAGSAVTCHIATSDTEPRSYAGFGTFKGELIIRAGFTVASAQRAEVTFESAQLQPAQLDKLFNKYLDLLLSIFNPDGWLDVTYLDDEMRVGRDDRGNLFVLERA